MSVLKDVRIPERNGRSDSGIDGAWNFQTFYFFYYFAFKYIFLTKQQFDKLPKLIINLVPVLAFETKVCSDMKSAY